MLAQSILLIDDDLELVNLLKQFLNHNGYEVFALTTGKNAIRTVQEKKPDLILSDIILPDKNGYDICYELKRNPDTASIPIILLTGKPDWKKEIEGMSKFVKADDDICKPFDLQELLEKIKKLLLKRGL